jgi:Fe2+ transport system protein FeoA
LKRAGPRTTERCKKLRQTAARANNTVRQRKMEMPLIIAHGENIVAIALGLFGLLAASIVLMIFGTALCLRKKEAAKVTGGRIHKLGAAGLLFSGVALMWIFWHPFHP